MEKIKLHFGSGVFPLANTIMWAPSKTRKKIQNRINAGKKK